MLINIPQPDFDIGIIGGGPAGSSLAAYLAKAGISCVLFEREIFPRPHVGESLVPAANRVLQELGLLEQMEAAKFPRKYGSAWTSVTSKKIYSHDFEGLPLDCRGDIRFDEREMQGDRNYTYHVDRAKFDHLLLQHARKLGATVYEGVRVNRVDLPKDDFPRIVISSEEQEVVKSVRLIVDASGRRTLLGSQLKLKVKDPVFNQFAIHTWFEGYDRGISDKKDYVFVHFLPISNSWIWQIPITDTITSFGVVTQKEHFAKKKQEREQFFWDCVSTHPEVFENLKQAKQLRPFEEEADYSYAMKQFCGDGWVLIGDAARFVDPIFSSGISIALNSARLASQEIIKALKQSTLKNGVFTREHLQDYEATVQRGMKNWYEFISLYYRLNILFTMFVSDPRYRLDILKLLSGEVYDEDEPQVLQEMRKIVTVVEQNSNHIWHKLLNELTANAFKPKVIPIVN
jgi:1H-pyrrole-2-carbonyl-[peptidyl-carrier protein] chlorinase